MFRSIVLLRRGIRLLRRASSSKPVRIHLQRLRQKSEDIRARNRFSAHILAHLALPKLHALLFGQPDQIHLFFSLFFHGVFQPVRKGLFCHPLPSRKFNFLSISSILNDRFKKFIFMCPIISPKKQKFNLFLSFTGLLFCSSPAGVTQSARRREQSCQQHAGGHSRSRRKQRSGQSVPGFRHPGSHVVNAHGVKTGFRAA